MRIIISPAKKMNIDIDSFPVKSAPDFINRTEILLKKLRSMSYKDLKALWRCNDQIAELNYTRLQAMDLHKNLTPAILSYEGIQYRYMAPGVFTQAELNYIEEKLRILSGFYGLLRPFDGVTPYRLEMQAKLPVSGAKDLYAFWGTSLAEKLFAETTCVINLASREYSRCVTPCIPADSRVITCVFGEWKDGKIIEKGTQCKMARGEMVRYMAERQITEPEYLCNFDRLGYRYSPAHSDANTYTFLKEPTKKDI